MLRPTRRELLGSAGAALAMMSMPSLVAACRRGPAALAPTDAPEAAYLGWFGVDHDLLRRVLATLGARGADYGELYFQYSRNTSISLEDGVVGRASVDIDQGVGLRVVIGQQVGYAFTQDLSEESLHEAARTASAIAAGLTARSAPVAWNTSPPGDRYRIAVPWSEVGVDERLKLVHAAEAQTRARAAGRGDAALDKVSVSFADVDEKVLIADLAGNLIVDDRPMGRLWVNCTASRGGQLQSNRSNLAGRHGLDWYTEARLDQVATEAIDRTYVLFDAVRPKAGVMPVVLAAGASGILLHEAIGHGMEADFNRKDVSIYASMIGRKVAPDFVTIVDDGTQAGERGALNYDDEGTPAVKTTLVRDGVLESYLHDKISATHYKLAPTGSGRRESYRHPPLPRMRSTYMENGPHSVDEILAGIEYGIVAETFTNGQVQIGAGDFTFFVKNGHLVENGKITAPIADVNIIGNGPDALQKMTMVAGDSKLDTGGWTCGKDGQSVPVSQGMPTVLVSALTVGGSDV
ncbi:MAG: metallopeptidase TldD-related protein [Myxococcota bacterium]